MSSIDPHVKANQALVRFWIWKQRTDERVYVSTSPPGPRARHGLRESGYKLYAVDIRLPDEAFCPEHDAVLDANATLLDDALVHVGDRIELLVGVERGQLGECCGVTDRYVEVRWGRDNSVGSYTHEAFRQLIETGRLKVNP